MALARALGDGPGDECLRTQHFQRFGGYHGSTAAQVRQTLKGSADELTGLPGDAGLDLEKAPASFVSVFPDRDRSLHEALHH